APHPALAMGGFALLGLGIAVVVPLCFAAAGRSGPNPSQAIAGVATITYTSGLVAPGAIGVLAETTSLVVSFALVTLLAFGVAGFAGVLRAGDRNPAGSAKSGTSGSSLPSEHPAG
ncbi:MFS transporter, partial [Streptomyces sp. UH6]|nr:MFS transporter [Streptomyces sp. UH6]